MNFHIRAELRRLKVHLQRYPEQAEQLAIAHLEDYLILFNECRYLEKQIELLRQSKTHLVDPDIDFSLNTQLTLENRFRVEILKRNLQGEPNHNQARFWAMEYFKHFLHKSEFYLEKRAELISLKKQPSLPYFL